MQSLQLKCATHQFFIQFKKDKREWFSEVSQLQLNTGLVQIHITMICTISWQFK